MTLLGTAQPKIFDKFWVNPNSIEMIALMELKNILSANLISTVFQPIISLSDAEVIGYEALSRGPSGSLLEQPDKLFSTAAKFNLVWELDYLCRINTLEKVREVIPYKMIFINVDPKIIDDPRFEKGHTKELLNKFCTNAGNVIFEITEKTAIEDYTSFCRILENYKSQGYKIAIDDTGSGYSGLRTLAETRPNFIKVDMELIRDVDKDTLKQAMLKALYDFSLNTNSKIIAEGIETLAELTTLINLGIPYGQGFFLQKPYPGFIDVTDQVKQAILEINHAKKREAFYTPINMPIGELARKDPSFPSSTPGYGAVNYLNSNPGILGLPVVDNNKPVGLLMKGKFLASLATQYGVAVYMNRPISTLMDKHPLAVDYDTPLELVSKSALSRKDDDIYDYVIITKDNDYYGTVSIKMLLEKTTLLELNRAKHANPLTGLPGNVMIEAELRKLITDYPAFAVLYFDLDNFKPYNDIYGFENGDKILGFTAQLLKSRLKENHNSETFLGHIGGDDFIAILQTHDVDELCQSIIAEFDKNIGNFYTEADRRKGYIKAKNRHGETEEFPVMSLSIAVVTNSRRSFSTVLELSEAASLLKKKCKLGWYSCYHID